jgi:hypothetical protein
MVEDQYLVLEQKRFSQNRLDTARAEEAGGGRN